MKETLQSRMLLRTKNRTTTPGTSRKSKTYKRRVIGEEHLGFPATRNLPL